MPTFLTREQIYRLLQRESPPEVYADGAPNAYVTTADMDATAQVFASAYETMQSIWNNMFVVSADEQLDRWETNLLGSSSVGDLTVEQRRGVLLAFLRSQDNISYWTIMNAVMGFVPAGTFVEMRLRAPRGDPVIAQLKGSLSGEVWGPDWVAGDPAPAGVTVSDLIRNSETDLLYLRRHAYVYDVLIWGYEFDPGEEDRLDDLLSQIEPAHVGHTIGALTEERTDGVEVSAANVENYQIAKTDDTSGTGYRTAAPYYFGFDDDDEALGFGDSETDAEAGALFWDIT